MQNIHFSRRECGALPKQCNVMDRELDLVQLFLKHMTPKKHALFSHVHYLQFSVQHEHFIFAVDICLMIILTKGKTLGHGTIFPEL